MLYEGKNQDPPCGTCRVDPFDENFDALRVFMFVRYQFIMGAGGPIDLNHIAIDGAIMREGIQDPSVFNKVLKLGEWWLQRIRNESQKLEP